MDVVTGKAGPVVGYFQPTFLYEMIWDLLVFAPLIWADRRFRLARGQVFLLYVMGYTVGRFVVESLRSDTANHIFGMRVNNWVSILVFLAALAGFLRQRGKPRSAALDGQQTENPDEAPAEAPAETPDTQPDADPVDHQAGKA